MMTESGEPRTWGPLSAPERRVLGVLVEKAKTTPDAYPMSVNAVTVACNQKTARDPLTNYDNDDSEETLQALRKKGLTVMVDAGGRVMRWRHDLYECWKITKVEAAVLAELWLRGAQTEGDLRARAARMEPIADLPTLQTILQGLQKRGMVVYLTPPGVRRGVIVTHGFFTPEALERERAKHAHAIASADADDPPASSTGAASGSPRSALAEKVERLEAELERQGAEIRELAEQVRSLKNALGD